jgi:hypothetical protein
MSEEYDKVLIRMADAIAAEKVLKYKTRFTSVHGDPDSKHLQNTNCSKS